MTSIFIFFKNIVMHNYRVADLKFLNLLKRYTSWKFNDMDVYHNTFTILTKLSYRQ
jgi:hypothetical protein